MEAPDTAINVVPANEASLLEMFLDAGMLEVSRPTNPRAVVRIELRALSGN